MAMLLPEKWHETKFVSSPTPSGNSIQLSPGTNRDWFQNPTADTQPFCTVS